MKIKYILLMCLLLVGCSQDRIVCIGGIDVSSGDILSIYDTHGGFHGDGISFVEMSFSEKTVEYAMKQNPRWKELLLTDNLRALIYGIDNVSEQIGPYLTDDNNDCLFPMIKNGYYFFEDRQSKDNSLDDTELLNRSSFNMTLAIYDSDTRKLYYCEFDT